MASNKELTDQILVIAAELNKPVETNGLKNDDLVALLGKLTEEKTALASAPPAGSGPQAGSTDGAGANELAAARQRAKDAAAANELREAAAKAAATGASKWVVAPGLSVTCLRGIVDAGQPISANDFGGKDADLSDLVRRGAVVKRA
jgi:hypothetical protein